MTRQRGLLRVFSIAILFTASLDPIKQASAGSIISLGEDPSFQLQETLTFDTKPANNDVTVKIMPSQAGDISISFLKLGKATYLAQNPTIAQNGDTITMTIAKAADSIAGDVAATDTGSIKVIERVSSNVVQYTNTSKQIQSLGLSIDIKPNMKTVGKKDQAQGEIGFQVVSITAGQPPKLLDDAFFSKMIQGNDSFNLEGTLGFSLSLAAGQSQAIRIDAIVAGSAANNLPLPPLPTIIPEPTALTLFCIGTLPLLVYAWHRRSRVAA